MYQSFEYSLDDGIALVRLNRPNKLNAIDHTMVREFGELAANIRADKNVRVVIFTGNGRATKTFVCRQWLLWFTSSAAVTQQRQRQRQASEDSKSATPVCRAHPDDWLFLARKPLVSYKEPPTPFQDLCDATAIAAFGGNIFKYEPPLPPPVFLDVARKKPPQKATSGGAVDTKKRKRGSGAVVAPTAIAKKRALKRARRALVADHAVFVDAVEKGAAGTLAGFSAAPLQTDDPLWPPLPLPVKISRALKRAEAKLAKN